jgi:UDP-N-acetylmuramoyl-L-alanyl-D-glutamate--2,6-diaminopimelate ligase
MGSVADKFADIIIVTSDNPRTEDPDVIINEIVDGIMDSNKVVKIIDRHSAIKYAITQYAKKYPILIAGKGHEDYQIIQGVKHHFDDREEVKNCFA